MIVSSNLGFPRIGPDRELKKALEGYWSGKTGQQALQETCRSIRLGNLGNGNRRRESGTSPRTTFPCTITCWTPASWSGPSRRVSTGTADRHRWQPDSAMARGGAKTNVPPLEMTKWFDTNYHYLVPELEPGQKFRLGSTKPVDEFQEAKSLGIHTRPVLLGPVTYLLLGKSRGEGFHNLSLLMGVAARV